MNIEQFEKTYNDYYNNTDLTDYMLLLAEQLNNDTLYFKQQVYKIVDLETDKKICLGHNKVEKLKQYIIDNMEQFIKPFYNYYVGDNSLNAVSFGEIEVPLEGLNLELIEYIRGNYYVDDNNQYAYIDLTSEGINLFLDLNDIEIKQILNL